jgi:hypothetical protein
MFIRDLFRAWPLAFWSLIFLVVVFLFNPAQFGIFFWGLLKLTAAGYGAYILDKVIFPYARPGLAPEEPHEVAWMLRRALIVAGALIAMGANL